MKKGKYLATLSTMIAGIVFAQSVSVSALEVNKQDITYKNGEISVPVVSDSGEAVTYEVYMGETPSKNTIRGFGEEYPVDEKCLLVFGLKDTDEYKLRISDGKDTIVVDGIVYASVNDRAAFMELVNSALAMGTESSENIKAAADKIHNLITDENNYKSITTIGVNVEQYVDYSSKIQGEICNGIAKSNANETITEKIFADVYREVEAVVRINSGTDEDGIDAVAGLNLEFEGLYFDEISDASKQEWIAKAVVANKPYDSMSDIQEAYGKANALYLINTARVTNIEKTVREYAELLDIKNDKEYTTYIKVAKSSINTALVEELSSRKPETIEEFLRVLKQVVEVPKDNSNGGGGSGGGFGGGTVKNNYEIGGVQNPAVNDTNTESTDNDRGFSDVSKAHWAYDAIEKMHSEGIISGYGDGTFLPNRTVKREEFVKMIIAAFNLENQSASSHFHDVFDSDWFYPYVSAAFEKGIVKGDNLGLFGVNAGITREDAVVIAARVLKLVDKSSEATRDYAVFSDETMIADYAKDAVKELYCMGKISGTDDGKFEPQRFCTRAEAAMIIYNISR